MIRTLGSHFGRRRRRRNPQPRLIEALEQRQLLAVTPTGDDQLVNNVVTRIQQTVAGSQSVAMQDNGDFFVVFQGSGRGDVNGVWGRLYNTDGSAQGNAFLINETTAGFQHHASVAALSDGSWAVVWQGRGAGDRHGIFARKFDADGNAVTGEMMVNETAGGVQERPQVVSSGEGGFTVAWSGFGPRDLAGIFFRIFDGAGTAQSGEIRANSTVVSRQDFPSLAKAGDDLILSWSSFAQDSSGWGVVARRFSADGTALTGEMLVNDTLLRDQLFSDVTGQQDGSFVVSFSSQRSIASQFDFFAQMFDAGNDRVGDNFLLHERVLLDQAPGQLTAMSNGTYLATWMSELGDGSGLSVLVRQFDAEGDPMGPEMVVSRTTVADQRFPSIAEDAEGNAVIVWSGFGPGDPQGVYFRQFATDEEPQIPNEPPDLDPPGEFTTRVGEQVAFTATATDPNDDSLIFILDDDAPDGATIDPNTGEFSFTPTAEQGGMTFTFSIIVIDDGDPPLSDTETVTITVEQNQAPDLDAPGEFQTNVNNELTFTATATDPDDDNLTFLLDDDAPDGATIDPTTGEFSFTPTPEQGGMTFTFRILVIDDGAPPLSDSEEVTITVGDNRPPDLAPIDQRQTTAGQEVSFTATATDPDDNDLTFILDDNAPDGATIDPETGEFSWTPTGDQIGNFTFNIIVIDDGVPPAADAEQVSITVGPNNPPDLEDPADATITTLQEFSFTASAADPDGNDVIFLLDDDAPDGTSIDPQTGQFTWTPTSQQFGTFDITIIVVDDGDPAGVDTETFTITVQAAPQAVNDEATTTVEMDVVVDVLNNDGDLDGTIDPTTVVIDDDADNGTTSIDDATGEVTYTPDAEFFGTDTFTYTVMDNDGLVSNVATVTLTVLSPPTANDDNASAAQNGSVVIDVLNNDADLDGAIDPTTVAIDDDADNGTTSVDPGTGEITYTPGTDFTGTDTFTYTVFDDDGLESNAATVTIIVAIPPTAVDDDSQATSGVPVVIDVVDNDTDSDGNIDPTTVAIVDDVDNGTTSVDPVTGEVTYTPNANFFGTETFTYTVFDDQGLISNVATVTVEVLSPPTAVDDDSQTPINQSVTIDVVDNDTDPDGTIDPTTVVIDDDADNGTTSIDPGTGEVTYTPNTDFTGSDSFTYTVMDDDGLTSNTATVSIEVLVPPTAVDDDAFTNNDSSVVIDVLDNDSDDGTIDPTTVSIVDDVDNGTTSIDPGTGEVTYTPNDDHFGIDTFTYTVMDDDGLTSNTATVTIDVNAPPVVEELITVNVDQGQSVQIDLLQNAFDVDGMIDPSTIEIVADPQAGEVTVDANGIATYTDQNILLADSFSFTVMDDDGAVSNQGNVLISTIPLDPAAGSTSFASSEEEDGPDDDALFLTSESSISDDPPSEDEENWEDLVDELFELAGQS